MTCAFQQSQARPSACLDWSYSPERSPMRIGVLTGGGDVPGLNPCIKAVVYSAVERGGQVVGLPRGWAGLHSTPSSSATAAGCTPCTCSAGPASDCSEGVS